MKSQVFLKKLKTLKSILLIRRVSGSSMLPKFKPGQIIIATGVFSALKAGDVIMFKHNRIEKLKRIVRRDKNGLYVVGDNASHSTDSRHFGTISVSSVLARVVWPR